MTTQPTLSGGSCFICGSTGLHVRRYLKLDSNSFLRNAAYALPTSIGRFLARMVPRFDRAYRPVRLNRRYFDREAVYCPQCGSGRVFPPLNASALSTYYRDFYWANRDAVDGEHLPSAGVPNERQRVRNQARLEWIRKWLPSFESAIDFGAGDCAAAFEMAQTARVHVVDPSSRARELSARYGVGYSPDLNEAPVVDLIYTAHSIEHVADLLQTIEDLLRHVRPNGYIFFETPNIGDSHVFDGLVHTPHTYMISGRTFSFLEQIFSVRVVAMESCGPEWRLSHPHIDSAERADLRVLLQRTDSLFAGAST